MFQHYVAGFAFSKDATTVALIRKNRPAWQAGKLNAIGGHVEPGEIPIEAQVREYWEETGVKSRPEDWTLFAVLQGGGMDGYKVNFYYSTNEDLLKVTSVTDEEIVVVKWQEKLYPCSKNDLMHNLRWLGEAARDNILNHRFMLKANV